jgi:hypothetical protein
MKDLKENIKDCFDRNAIEYREHGKNIKKGNIGICCPFCEDDTGFHLGIRNDGMYSCWKDSAHHGFITTLLNKLLHCTYYEALEELQIVEVADENGMIQAVNRLFETKPEIVKEDKRLIMPNNFYDILPHGSTKRFYDYLKGRGFSDVEAVCKHYKIKCCMTDDYADRVIFPVYEEGELITWQGRSIYPQEKLKYKAQPSVEAVKKTTDCLSNYDYITKGGVVLFICEGYFDMMKMDWYSPEEVKATSLFTKIMSTTQQALLLTVVDRYEQIVILLDPDAESNARNILDEIGWMKRNITLGSIPKGIKDPGDLTRLQVYQTILDNL